MCYVNSNSSSPSFCGSPATRHFKGKSITFSCKLDFACVHKFGVCFSLQVPFSLNHKESRILAYLLVPSIVFEYVSSVGFWQGFFLPLYFTKCLLSACELQMTTISHFFNSLTKTFQVSTFFAYIPLYNP